MRGWVTSCRVRMSSMVILWAARAGGPALRQRTMAASYRHLLFGIGGPRPALGSRPEAGTLWGLAIRWQANAARATVRALTLCRRAESSPVQPPGTGSAASSTGERGGLAVVAS